MGSSFADSYLKESCNKRPFFAGLVLGAQFGVLLPYSRAHEAEADVIGLRDMAQASNIPKDAVSLHYWAADTLA